MSAMPPKRESSERPELLTLIYGERVPGRVTVFLLEFYDAGEYADNEAEDRGDDTPAEFWCTHPAWNPQSEAEYNRAAEGNPPADLLPAFPMRFSFEHGSHYLEIAGVGKVPLQLKPTREEVGTAGVIAVTAISRDTLLTLGHAFTRAGWHCWKGK